MFGIITCETYNRSLLHLKNWDDKKRWKIFENFPNFFKKFSKKFQICIQIFFIFSWIKCTYTKCITCTCISCHAMRTSHSRVHDMKFIYMKMHTRKRTYMRVCMCMRLIFATNLVCASFYLYYWRWNVSIRTCTVNMARNAFTLYDTLRVNLLKAYHVLNLYNRFSQFPCMTCECNMTSSRCFFLRVFFFS